MWKNQGSWNFSHAKLIPNSSSFWSNGSWFILYKDIDGNFRKLDTGDNILYEKWMLMEDSVIFIGGHKFMIRRITNKEMLLERNNKVGRLKFIK